MDVAILEVRAEQVQQIRERLAKKSGYDWLHVVGSDGGKNWSVTWCTGLGMDGKNHYITTDHAKGDEVAPAEDDAEFIAHAPEDIRFLLGELDRMTLRLQEAQP